VNEANSPDTERQRARARLDKLSWLLDDSVRIPGTNFRLGLDSIIGLIPGLGDVIGLVLGAGIVYQGVRLDAPRPLIVKMLGNAAADAIGGLLPFVGDLFDFAFKSNRRNAKLLIEHLDSLEPKASGPAAKNRVKAIAIVVVFLGLGLGLLWLVWSAILNQQLF
tara:strand:+ start:1030 stop:1521 length:492 start_codon:yes stop_codon:yes gene_type:complete